MRSFGLVLLVVGICLISLSGLEKIMIYVSFSERGYDMQAINIITPTEIWNITLMTKRFGILIVIIGLIMAMWNPIKIELKKIKAANRQFEIEHGMNKSMDENE